MYDTILFHVHQDRHFCQHSPSIEGTGKFLGLMPIALTSFSNLTRSSGWLVTICYIGQCTNSTFPKAKTSRNVVVLNVNVFVSLSDSLVLS